MPCIKDIPPRLLKKQILCQFGFIPCISDKLMNTKEFASHSIAKCFPQFAKMVKQKGKSGKWIPFFHFF